MAFHHHSQRQNGESAAEHCLARHSTFVSRGNIGSIGSGRKADMIDGGFILMDLQTCLCEPNRIEKARPLSTFLPDQAQSLHFTYTSTQALHYDT